MLLLCAISISAGAAAALPGHIWDVAAGQEISRATLFERLRSAQVVLLGETHDSPAHHGMQLEAIDAITSTGARPALVMEQFDTTMQAAMDTARAAASPSAEALAQAGRLDRGGWRSEYYLPLIERALHLDLPVRAANFPREAARELTHAGADALSAPAWQALATDRVWSAERQTILEREIVSGHCGHDLGPLQDGMIAAQRARDATMADVILSQASSGAIAIIGRGHARKDIAVPIYLAARDPALRVASVGLIEADPQRALPTEYAESGLYDYLWFSAATPRPDPCQGFDRPRRQAAQAGHQLESAPQQP